MASALALLVMIVVVMVLVVVVVTVASAFALLIVIVMMVMVVCLLHQLVKDRGKRIGTRGSRKDLLTGKLIPRRSNNHSIGIVLAQERNTRGNGRLAHISGTRKHDGASVLNLVIEKLTKVFHIHTALLGVNHNRGTAKLGALKREPLHRTDHIAELTNTRGLDQDTVGCILGHNLLECLVEVTDKTAADATGIHLINGNTGLSEKAPVNTDLTKLVFNQHKLFARIGLGNQFFDQRSLSRTEKARKNINPCHVFLPKLQSRYRKKLNGINQSIDKGRKVRSFFPAVTAKETIQCRNRCIINVKDSRVDKALDRLFLNGRNATAEILDLRTGANQLHKAGGGLIVGIEPNTVYLFVSHCRANLHIVDLFTDFSIVLKILNR